MKQCTKCQKIKPLSEFYPISVTSKGKIYNYLSSKCSECIKIINQEWRKKNKEKVATIHTRSQRKPKTRYKSAKRNSIKRHKEWNLTEEEFTTAISIPCFYCNGYLGQVERGCGLDRLDNSRGYELNNVVSCCFTCNMVKNTMFSPEETKAMIQIVLRLRGLIS